MFNNSIDIVGGKKTRLGIYELNFLLKHRLPDRHTDEARRLISFCR